MKKLHISLLLGACAGMVLAGCNALQAFQGDGSDLDKIELAEKCLRDGDFDCAVTNYTLISDVNLRAEKLCAARLSQAGFGISQLVTVLIDNSGSASVLGRLAEALVTWTQARQTAADAAKTQCAAFYAANPNPTDIKRNRAVLLKALSAFVHCATLVAKTDVLRTENGTTCTFPWQRNGPIGPDSASNDATLGTVSAGNAGMCNADVAACVDDFSEISTDTAVLGSSVPDIATAYSNIPADLKNGAVAADVGRLALRSAL